LRSKAIAVSTTLAIAIVARSLRPHLTKHDLKIACPGGTVSVVDMTTQRIRPATPDQIESGRYFENLDEYRAANAA
jgi:hypothetical protein